MDTGHRRHIRLPWSALWWQYKRVRRWSMRFPQYYNLFIYFDRPFTYSSIVFWGLFVHLLIYLHLIHLQVLTLTQYVKRGSVDVQQHSVLPDDSLVNEHVSVTHMWKVYFFTCDSRTNYSAAITSDGEANGVLFLTPVAGPPWRAEPCRETDDGAEQNDPFVQDELQTKYLYYIWQLRWWLICRLTSVMNVRNWEAKKKRER